MDDAAYWLALQRAPGLGARSVVRLLERFPQPREVFAAARDGPPDPGIGPEALAYLRSPDWSAIEADCEWLKAPSHHLVTLTDHRFPPLLAETGDPPLLLFVHGRVDLLAGPQLAIVGSRHPTPGGRRPDHHQRSGPGNRWREPSGCPRGRWFDPGCGGHRA